MKESSIIQKIDRRSFLKTSSLGATGIVLGLGIRCSTAKATEPANFEPNVYLTLNEKGEVSIIAHRSEMGQAVRTSLPTIIADEMEADWSKVKIVQAEGNEEKYGNQNTDGSFTVRMFYEPMRKAGATARTMLEQAAAEEWGVDASGCKAENHKVVHSSGKSLDFGVLAKRASELEVPTDIQLKNESDFKYIGKDQPLVDLKNIVTGRGVYGMDTQADGMKIAMMVRPPVAGGKVKSFDKAEASEIPGVIDVFEMEGANFPTGFQNPLGGIAIVAENTWAAMKARRVLHVEWDHGANVVYNSGDYKENLIKSAKGKGQIHREEGDVEKAFGGATKVLDQMYSVPHHSHAQMEPPAVLAYFDDAGKCQILAPTQNPQWVKSTIAQELGVEEDQVIVNVTLLGGGFGRKSKPDFCVEAMRIAKQTGEKIKLIWTREDDIQHDFLNSCGVHRIKVGIDRNNNVSAWNHHALFPSIGGTANPQAKGASTGELCQGAVDMPFQIDNICLETHEALTQTRIGWLRSVHNIHIGFAIGTMVDEIAEARGVDRVDNIIDLLGEDRSIPFDKLVNGFRNYNESLEDYPWETARLKKVVQEVAKKSNFGKDLPEGRGQGICVHRSFLTYVACVVEVDLTEKGKIKIPQVHYAVDCGKVVNPDRVKSQFEGGAVFASSGALKSAITFKEGAIEQSNYHDYEVARMSDAPGRIFVHLMESNEKPTGVGEPPVPPFAPALGNAIYAASGKRVRDLPIDTESLWS